MASSSPPPFWISRTSAATSRGAPLDGALSRASTPRRLPTSWQRSVPSSSRRASWSEKPTSTQRRMSSLNGRGPRSSAAADPFLSWRSSMARNCSNNSPACRALERVDAETAAAAGIEVAVLREAERAHEQEEIRFVFRAEQVVAFLVHLAALAAGEQISRLRERSEQSDGTHAIPFARGEQHAGVARMHREGEHLTADGIQAGRWRGRARRDP